MRALEIAQRDAFKYHQTIKPDLRFHSTRLTLKFSKNISARNLGGIFGWWTFQRSLNASYVIYFILKSAPQMKPQKTDENLTFSGPD